MLQDDLRKDIDALLPSVGGSRRAALQLMLGAGYAAAAGPVMAQTAIKTPAKGLTQGRIDYTVDGFQVPAYHAAPAGKKNLPVMLVIQEIFGVHEYIADVCRRFAHAGYLAIAPELYARQGDASKYTDIAKLMDELVSKVPDAQVLGDLDGAVQWAGAHGGNAKKLGINGFCWGGRIVWLYAAQGPVTAGVAWYGRLTGQTSELTPKNPVDIAAHLNGPVLGLYGGQDPGNPPQAIEQMKAELAKGNAASRASEFVVYPDAPHAFHADYRPSYRKQAAEDGYRRALAWFKKHGVA